MECLIFMAYDTVLLAAFAAVRLFLLTVMMSRHKKIPVLLAAVWQK